MSIAIARGLRVEDARVARIGREIVGEVEDQARIAREYILVLDPIGLGRIERLLLVAGPTAQPPAGDQLQRIEYLETRHAIYRADRKSALSGKRGSVGVDLVSRGISKRQN